MKPLRDRGCGRVEEALTLGPQRCPHLVRRPHRLIPHELGVDDMNGSDRCAQGRFSPNSGFSHENWSRATGSHFHVYYRASAGTAETPRQEFPG
jgi:hypothetical protein